MVLLVPKIYAEIALGFDLIMLTTALLFRKPKHKKEIRSPDPKSTKLAGIYVTASAIALLVGNHFVSFPSYLSYFTGLSLDTLIFYVGVKALVS